MEVYRVVLAVSFRLSLRFHFRLVVRIANHCSNPERSASQRKSVSTPAVKLYAPCRPSRSDSSPPATGEQDAHLLADGPVSPTASHTLRAGLAQLSIESDSLRSGGRYMSGQLGVVDGEVVDDMTTRVQLLKRVRLLCLKGS